MALVALLIFFVVLGVAALAVDVGSNFDNRQQLQSVADLAALAGAEQTGIDATTILPDTQELIWQNLGVTPASVACAGSPCTISAGGYTATVIYPYTPFNPTVNDYPPELTVAVDITHLNPVHGFEGFLGFGPTTIRVHAAAAGLPGTRQFPFALATRFLDLTGGGTIAAYGSVLVDQCSDSGQGDFTDHGYNGGLYFNGGTGLLLGAAYTSYDSGQYSNAEAVLVADPAGTTCPGGANQSASAGLSGFTDQVHFSSTAPYYNYFYGFNSGPSGCTTSTDSGCQSDPEGAPHYSWQDPSCWQSGPGAASVAWTQSYAYPSSPGPGVTIVPSGTAVACPQPDPSTYPNEPYGTMEGSFPAARFPNFPEYATPEELVQELSGDAAVPGAVPGQITGITQTGATYQNTGQNWTFPAGVYVVDGPSALPVVKGSFNCLSDGGGNQYPNGCVFILENGASLQVQGSKSSLNCSYSLSGDAGCSFYLADSTTPTQSVFSLSNSANGILSPIPFQPTCASGPCPLANFPVVYSNGTSTTGSTSSLNLSAVVSISNPGSFAFNGTIYVPHGIFSSNANAGSSSGQVIADSIRLQGGSGSSSGVAYNGNSTAPVVGAARLIE
jgi:hypothetical protein